MRVCYAINERIGGAGIGTPAYYACSALHAQGLLQQALSLGFQQIGHEQFAEKVRTVVPFGKLLSHCCFGLQQCVPSFPAYTIRNNIFDFLASKQIQACDVFHGWSGHCLLTIREAKQWDSISIVETGSTHLSYRTRLLQQEYRKHKVPYQPIEPAVMRKCLKEFSAADYILVNSSFSLQTYLKQGIAREKMLLIPRGVNVEKFSRKKRSYPERFTVLYVGLLNVRKGLPYLLQAWEQLDWKDATLVLAGPVTREGRLLLQRYASNPTIQVKGFVKDVAREYHHASVFALPTLEEGFAKATLEAMASGLPLITTMHAGSPARHGREGWIIPSRSVEKLKQALQYFKNHPEQIQKYGKRGEKMARAFTWENYKRNVLKTYRSLAP